ncbi:hypothetical protein [Pseudacidovorax sp. RU35E]|jgi:hypothetical protein|uniref:hypothetical protein n=1 Tax=Pseudacidovorax sp. RU35E TaxID=1907403 RepID=UPI000954B367|nr:hypothetical protein [Pseudacidovorax sp. RU35E]SIQ01638.1 hypothetical protein SAMN05880557_101528 [Pseudacidovorax sp. RU35E]
MNLNNPAARLYEFLMRARAYPKDRKSREVLYELLDTENDGDLFERFGQLRKLVDEIAEENSRQGFTGRFTTYWVGPVQRAFQNVHFSGTWNTFIDSLDETAIMFLESTVDILNERIVKLEEEDLENYRARLNEILEKVLASNESEEFKIYFKNSVGKIIDTLDNYKITGDKALFSAFNEAVGGMVTDENLRTQADRSDFIKKAFAVLKSGLDLASKMKGASEAISYFQDKIQ